MKKILLSLFIILGAIAFLSGDSKAQASCSPSSYYPLNSGGTAHSYLNVSTGVCTQGTYTGYYTAPAVSTTNSDNGKSVKIQPCSYDYYSTTNCTGSPIGYNLCSSATVSCTVPTSTPTPTPQPATPTPTPSGGTCTCYTCSNGACVTAAGSPNLTGPCSNYGYYNTNTCNNSCYTPPPPPPPTATPTPAPSTFTISGYVFIDTNSDGIRQSGESTYSLGTINITSSGGTVSYPLGQSNGYFTVSGLSTNPYTISYTNPPTASGYYFTEPLNGTSPRSFYVNVGTGCTPGAKITGSKNATYDSSCNIVNLDFGINNLNPWIQSSGSDMRIDSGFTDLIPSGATCGSYASNLNTSGTPGIIYSGATDPNFGNGQASQNPPYGWSVGDGTNPEKYSPSASGVIKTSYSYIYSLIARNGNALGDIAAYCGSGGISNCTLSPIIPNGAYVAKGNLTLNGSGFNFPTNKNYIILVNGDLNVNEKILVPNGSTAFFTASGNINIAPSIGESSTTLCQAPTSLNSYSSGCDLEGYYSTDKNFIVKGASVCPGSPDTRLNVGGSIVVNAALNGGSFENERNLCSQDAECPAFSITERPDFVLNSPLLIMNSRRIYREVAP